MALYNGNNNFSNQETKIDILSLIPNNVQIPSIPEGELILTIKNCKILRSSYGNGEKRIEMELMSDEYGIIKEIFPLSSRVVTFAKHLDSIFGELPPGEIDLEILNGTKVKAYIYHNYTNKGQGYANIATMEFLQSNTDEE